MGEGEGAGGYVRQYRRIPASVSTNTCTGIDEREQRYGCFRPEEWRLQSVVQVVRQAVLSLQTQLFAEAVAHGFYATDRDIQQGGNLFGGEVHLQVGTHHALVVRQVGMAFVKPLHEIVVQQVKLFLNAFQDFVALDVRIYFSIERD